jgi:hypothetical protein
MEVAIKSAFSIQVQKVAGDSVATIILAGFSAIIVGVGGISPYKPDIKKGLD